MASYTMRQRWVSIIYVDGVFNTATNIAAGSTNNTLNLFFGSRSGSSNFLKVL